MQQDPQEDYTGQLLPGVWHLEPSEDSFRVQLHRKGALMLDVTRIQYPLAPLAAGTYNNAQSKTIKGVGHTIDFSKPDNFSADDYTQHLYMILGRAQALEYSLFRNLPKTPEGDIDFSIFETGPPAYIAEFLDRLEDSDVLVGLFNVLYWISTD